MTTKQVADRLVELCRQGKIFETQEELYADDCISIESDNAPVKEVKGKCVNPYGDGQSAKRILDIIRSLPVDNKLIVKDITY